MTNTDALIFAEKFMRCNFNECLNTDMDCASCEHDYEKVGTLDDFLKNAMDALKKQIPKKVVRKKAAIYAKALDGKEFCLTRPHCPTCGSEELSSGYPCKCGQILDWS